MVGMESHRALASIRLRAVAGAAGLAILGAVGAAPASAATPCPKSPKHVVAQAPDARDGYAYRVGKVLYGCGRVDVGYRRQVRKLGPWTPESKVRIDGIHTVVWTERRTSAGRSEDRIWAATLASRPWLRGIASVRKPSDRLVARLLPGPAWVTEGGAVAIAKMKYDASSVALVGAGTPGASGLVAVPKPAGARLELGRWGAGAVDALADSFTIEDRGGDADGCAAVNAYAALVTPVAGQAAVGVEWQQTDTFDCG